MDVQVYRPGSTLAVVVLLLPAAVALGGALIALDTGGRVPVWLPFALLLLIPAMPLAWMSMQSVRTSTAAVGVGRPWQKWDEVPWVSIERVEAVGPTLRITASDDRRLSIWPALLRDGQRFERDLVLRLPPHVLAGRLAAKARVLIDGGIHAVSDGGPSGTLQARAWLGWRTIAAAVCVCAPAVAVAGLFVLPRGGALALAVACGLIEVGALAVFLRLVQRVTMDDKGVSVSGPLRRSARSMRWRDVELVEQSPHEWILRLRGKHRLRCLGPGILPGAESILMRAFIAEYCVNRDVPIVKRRWLL